MTSFELETCQFISPLNELIMPPSEKLFDHDSAKYQLEVSNQDESQLSDMAIGSGSENITVKKPQVSVRFYKCQLCDYESTKKYALKEHLKKVHERIFPCDQCHFVLNCNANLQRHKMYHTGKYPFLCDICGCASLTERRLRDHQLIHTYANVAKPFNCDLCSFKTIWKNSLKKHKDGHLKPATNQEKPTCEIDLTNSLLAEDGLEDQESSNSLSLKQEDFSNVSLNLQDTDSQISLHSAVKTKLKQKCLTKVNNTQTSASLAGDVVTHSVAGDPVAVKSKIKQKCSSKPKKPSIKKLSSGGCSSSSLKNKLTSSRKLIKSIMPVKLNMSSHVVELSTNSLENINQGTEKSFPSKTLFNGQSLINQNNPNTRQTVNAGISSHLVSQSNTPGKTQVMAFAVKSKVSGDNFINRPLHYANKGSKSTNVTPIKNNLLAVKSSASLDGFPISQIQSVHKTLSSIETENSSDGKSNKQLPKHFHSVTALPKVKTYRTYSKGPKQVVANSRAFSSFNLLRDQNRPINSEESNKEAASMEDMSNQFILNQRDCQIDLPKPFDEIDTPFDNINNFSKLRNIRETSNDLDDSALTPSNGVIAFTMSSDADISSTNEDILRKASTLFLDEDQPTSNDTELAAKLTVTGLPAEPTLFSDYEEYFSEDICPFENEFYTPTQPVTTASHQFTLNGHQTIKRHQPSIAPNDLIDSDIGTLNASEISDKTWKQIRFAESTKSESLKTVKAFKVARKSRLKHEWLTTVRPCFVKIEKMRPQTPKPQSSPTPQCKPKEPDLKITSKTRTHLRRACVY